MTGTRALTINAESPLQDDVRGLIKELNAVLHALTPPEFCFHMTAEQMAGPETTVFIARENGKAVACGALRRDKDGIAEVKRMYTRPAWQGRGIGGRILDEIMALARKEGFTRVVLETGDRHPAAWRVYERAGFTRCGRVLDYPDSPYSVFYEKVLDATSDLTDSSTHSGTKRFVESCRCCAQEGAANNAGNQSLLRHCHSDVFR